VAVVGGTCDIAIDGKSYGNKAGLTEMVRVGDHMVTCTPSGGPSQRQEVMIRERVRPVPVTFHVGRSAGPRRERAR
jgi:hypothetical protein